jgi:hypothetical protein
MFKMIVFDLDWTLAPSKWQMDNEMVELFKKLLSKYKVWVISGWDYSQFQKQIVPFLGDDEKLLSNLYLCPTCSTKMYLYENWEWIKKYSLDFSPDEKKYIIDVLNKAIDDLELRPEKTWWELIEDRWTQITYSALWQQAPLEVKHTWDPEFEKRKKIRNYLLKDLQNYNILIGWATSIDITRAWVDKAYWVKKLSEFSWISLDEMIFVWDAVFPGGNDYPPLEIWVTSKRVFSVDDTKSYIKMLIS